MSVMVPLDADLTRGERNHMPVMLRRSFGHRSFFFFRGDYRF